MRLHEFGQTRPEPFHREARRAVNGEHLRERIERHFGACGFDHIEHTSKALMQAPAFGCRLHTPVAPMKKRPAEILFEFLHLMADRRLREMKLACGKREAFEPRGGFERA